MDKRKKIKIMIEILPRDIDCLEDLTECIPLCVKHKSLDRPKTSERDLMTMYYECKECEKVYNKWNKGASRIETAIWKEYGKMFK